MNKKSFTVFTLLALLLIFPLNNLFAAANSDSEKEDSVSFRGKRVDEDNDSINLTGAKISQADDGNIYLELFFNSEINPRSFIKDTIFINNEPVIQESMQILFSKNSRSVKIPVKKGSPAYENIKKNKSFSIKVQNISSFDKKSFPATEISNVEINTQYNYSVKEKLWKKS